MDHEHPNDGHSVLIKSSGPINVAIITHGKNEKKMSQKAIHTTYETAIFDPQL